MGRVAVMRSVRPVVGPLIVGLAVWCAAGDLTVIGVETASQRLAAPAPWWLLACAWVLAFGVAPWRRDPGLAMPALMTTVPWWPVPLPPIALVWTGALAWVPIATAVACAIGRRPIAALARILGADQPRRAPWLAATLTIVVGATAAAVVSPRIPAGDEPHYLVITQSLLNDGDLDVGNNHEQRDYAAYFKDDLGGVHGFLRGRHGESYSIHSPGISVAVLPGFLLAGYRGAQATVLLLAGLAVFLMWQVAWRVTRDAASAWFAWAVIAGSTTFLWNTFTVFPDGGAMLAVAAGTLLLLEVSTEAGRRPARLCGLSTLVSGLPWLHTRFVVLTVSLVAAAAWMLVREGPSAYGGSRPTSAGRTRAIACVCAPMLVSGALWIVHFMILYGTPNPLAPYGDTSGPAGTHWYYAPGGLMGLVFDQEFGLLAYAPALSLAVIGAWRASHQPVRRAVAAACGVATAYLVIAATYWMWWAGHSAPARIAAAVLPVAAAPLAIFWSRSRAAGRAAGLALLLVSIGQTFLLVVVNRGEFAWNEGIGQAQLLNWLGPVVDLPAGWPSFFRQLDPRNLATEWPFVIQILIAIGCAACVWWTVRRVLASHVQPSQHPVVAAWALVAGLSAIVQAGWWLQGVNGLDPARSQVAWLQAAANGRDLLRVSPGAITSASVPRDAVRIRPEARPHLEWEAPLLALYDLPPGEYQLHVSMARPGPASATLHLNGSEGARRTIPLAGHSRQTLGLQVPAGSWAVTLTPDADAAAARTQVELVPLSVRQ